jgi:hypothetical protein
MKTNATGDSKSPDREIRQSFRRPLGPAAVYALAVSFFLLGVSATCLWGLVHPFTARSPEVRPPDLAAEYRAAIADAAVRDDRNVYGGLISITPANNDLVWRSPDRLELLVLTFVTSAVANQYYRPGSRGATPDGDPRVWVTLAPELQRFCRRLGMADPTERLKEYLGLSPDNKNDEIVEIWVKRNDLFRPCPDPEVNDSVCSLKSSSLPPKVKNVPDYRLFLLNLYEQSYRSGGAPWTGLGYTYDWANGQHGIGASEYMLVPKAEYEVQSVQPPASYCRR